MSIAMMIVLHFLEFLSFSVVQTDLYLMASEQQMNWYESFKYCKLSTFENVKEFNVTNVWLGGLYLQKPRMVHRGCFDIIGPWDVLAQPYSQFEWNITVSCSYECRKNKLFALRADNCACLNSLSNMELTKMDNCQYVCNGSKRDPCGDSRYYTIYEQKVENGTTYNRRPVIKWITNETFDEINETADNHNVKCLLLNESLQYVPMSCNLKYSALCEAGSKKEITTETNDNDMEASLSTTQSKKTLISGISTTTSPGTSKSDFGMPTYVTVITVVGALISVSIAIVVSLLLYRRKRKRIIYYSRNFASNDIHASLEREQTMQMFSTNDRSRNRTNTVPFILQQKQRPGNISVSNYQDPVDMENEYQRLDFSMRSDLKEVHDDYAMQVYKQTSTPAVNDNGSKPFKKAGLSKETIDLKEVYNNYSLPYDALSRPTLVNKDDMKIQIKVRPSVTMKDEKHNNVAYCDTAIVHEDFFYDIPKHSSKSLDNLCSKKKVK